MWLPHRVVMSWGQVTQVLMSKTARQIWLLMAFSMLLVWLYSYNTVHPTEPYIKRSHSSSTGAESVVVIFANKHNDNGNETTKFLSRPADRRDTPAASPPERGASSGSLVPAMDMPFLAERQFDVTKHVFRRLDSPASSPAEKEEIPPGILEMLVQSGEGIKDVLGPPRPGQKGSAHVAASVVNASRVEETHGDLQTKRKPPFQPSDWKSEGRHVPDWVLSLFFTGKAQDNPEAKPQTDSDNDQDMVDIVFTDLTDLDEERQVHRFENDEAEDLMDDDVEVDLKDVPPGPWNPGDLLKGKQFTGVQSPGWPGGSQGGVGDVSKRPPQESSEPPVQLPDLDSFSSTEILRAMKHKDSSGKLPKVSSAHENKKVKKLLHSSMFDPSMLTDLSGDLRDDSAELADKGDLKKAEAFHWLKKTTGKPNHVASPSNGTRTSTKLSATSPGEGLPDRHPDLKVQNHQSDLNFTLWRNVLKERKRLLRAKCQDNYFKQNVEETRALVDHKRNLLYCPVAKSASGFFHRLLFTLKHTNRSVREIPSPFEVSLSTALAEEFDTVSKIHRKGFDEFMANGVKFVVVREPFSRLFAAYVDRLLVPDSVYWMQWGIPAISRHRKYPSSKSLECGHDVTFAEYVKYVIDTLHDSDDTVKPVSTLCAPCDLHYSVIGHVETLISDIEYVLSLLKVSIANFSAQTFMNDVNDDIIYDSTIRAFEFYEHLKSCISKYEMGKRLWRNLQIHGIISEELTFSFAPKKVDKMTPWEFVKLVQEARQILPDSEQVQQQKFKALKVAFESVSSEDVMQLVKIYALDFEFFGYDRHPSFLS